MTEGLKGALENPTVKVMVYCALLMVTLLALSVLFKKAMPDLWLSFGGLFAIVGLALALVLVMVFASLRRR